MRLCPSPVVVNCVTWYPTALGPPIGPIGLDFSQPIENLVKYNCTKFEGDRTTNSGVTIGHRVVFNGALSDYQSRWRELRVCYAAAAA
jgi:hypothetical protein